MRTCRGFLAFIAFFCCAPAHGETAADCRYYFDRGDPRLFEFLETRAMVDYAEFEGLRIDRIEYVVLPIFNEEDPDEDNWLYRGINFLHIDTRHRTLEKELIFREGERLDKRTIRENERLLRDNDYLTDAMILPHSVCGERIHLLVVVRDLWTLTPEASFARAGGENKASIGITDKNLLGTGQELALGRFKDEDRSGFSVAYSNEQLFDNHFSLELTYADNSDGELRKASLARPFFEFNTRWSAGVSAHDETRLEEIETGGETINTFRQDIEEYEAFYGWSRGLEDGVVRRWSLGFTDAKNTFSRETPDALAPPPDRRLTYPWLSYESVEDRYLTTTNVSSIYRHEDILLGTRWSVRAGYATEGMGSTENAAIFNVANNYTTSFGEHHLLQVGGEANGRLNTDTGNLVSTFFSAEAVYHNFIDIKNRWFAHLQLDAGKNINQEEQLTSGGDFLRGYPKDFQRGNRRWIFTVERRRFSNWYPFNLIRVGGAAYIDIGRTWDTETPGVESTSTLANVGLGLRLASPKARRDKVVHIDIAAPLVERGRVDSYQLIISGKSEF